MNLRMAHISDLHFGVLTFDPRQFLSKRWIGNTNLLLVRSHRYTNDHLSLLPPFLEQLKVEALSITGDFSSTSLDEEFKKAAHYLKQMSMTTLVIPGNHDCYTKESEERSHFYRYFPDIELKKKGVATKKLNESWRWIGLDCTLATPPFHSYGLFTTTMEKHLQKILAALSPEEKVMVACHWPLDHFRGHRHDLKRKERLKMLLLAYPQVKLYLHGHDHNPTFRHENNLVMVGGGSLAKKNRAHFFLLDLTHEKIGIEEFQLKNQTKWEAIGKREIGI